VDVRVIFSPIPLFARLFPVRPAFSSLTGSAQKTFNAKARRRKGLKIVAALSGIMPLTETTMVVPNLPLLERGSVSRSNVLTFQNVTAQTERILTGEAAAGHRPALRFGTPRFLGVRWHDTVFSQRTCLATAKRRHACALHVAVKFNLEATRQAVFCLQPPEGGVPNVLC
jgi:hypothetical protein